MTRSLTVLSLLSASERFFSSCMIDMAHHGTNATVSQNSL
jgi:hypothetical protein